MLEFAESKIAEWPNNHSIIIGQDSSAKVGVADCQEVDEPPDVTLGRFGMKCVNPKGENLLNFCRSHNFRIANTWFEHESHATWKYFTSKMLNHQIDHYLVDQKLFKNVTDCQISNLGCASDHSSLVLKLNIRCDKKTQ